MGARKAGHYVVRTANLICEQIALGKTLQQALDEVGYVAPSLPTIWRWLDEHEDFRNRYERARRLQADTHADTMLEMSKEVISRPAAAAAYRVAIEVLKWQAEIRNRAKYSTKAEDPKDKTPMDANKLRAEIKRLESELGVAETKVQPLRRAK
jgi:terminase small subunit-like protein